MNQKRIKIRKWLISVLLLLTVFLCGSTYSWIRQDATVKNHLTSHTTDITVMEEETDFKAGSGTTQDKHVSFLNSGDSAVFLRTTYAEYWEKKTAGENVTRLLANQQDKNDVAIKNWSDKGFYNENLWFDGGDGWFYYKKILPAGAETEQVLQSVTFPEFTGEYAAYKGADYHLYFKAEVVQASLEESTLNASSVNADATWSIFEMTAYVCPDNIQVIWSQTDPHEQKRREAGNENEKV